MVHLYIQGSVTLLWERIRKNLIKLDWITSGGGGERGEQI